MMESKQRGGGGGEQFFFFNDTATTEIYTLSLHDALPILPDGMTATIIRTYASQSRIRFQNGTESEYVNKYLEGV